MTSFRRKISAIASYKGRCLLATYFVTVDFCGGRRRHTQDFNSLDVNRVAKGHEEEGVGGGVGISSQRRVFPLSMTVGV